MIHWKVWHRSSNIFGNEINTYTRRIQEANEEFNKQRLVRY